MARPKGSDGWSTIKDAVYDKPAPELVNLLRDLYELSPANRQFLHARCGSRFSRARSIPGLYSISALSGPPQQASRSFPRQREAPHP